MMNAIRDLRHAVRLLRRAPGFAATAILTLALGIGATTALFTVVDAVLLEPLPFPDSSKLVQVWRSELPALTYRSASYGRYLDWRRNQHAFTELGAWAPAGMTIAGREGPERVPGGQASASFFQVVGAPPVIGLYSVMSYTVAQRERELAIRSAVGASRSALLGLVLKEGLMLSGAGIAAGAAIAVAVSGVLRNLLYDVSATDPAVFIASAIGLGGIALAGYLIPAARAARVEPVVALRSE